MVQGENEVEIRIAKEEITSLIIYLQGNLKTVRFYAERHLTPLLGTGIFKKVLDSCSLYFLFISISDEETRSLAQKILLDGVSEQLIPDLVELLGDDNPNIRVASTNALAKVANKSLIPVFIKLTEDDILEVRLPAIQALGDVRDKRAIPILGDLLLSEHEFTRFAAAGAIEKIGYEHVNYTTKIICLLNNNNIRGLAKEGRKSIPVLLGLIYRPKFHFALSKITEVIVKIAKKIGIVELQKAIQDYTELTAGLGDKARKRVQKDTVSILCTDILLQLRKEKRRMSGILSQGKPKPPRTKKRLVRTLRVSSRP